MSKYNWQGSGPSGCDDHNINHPCGKCMVPKLYSYAPEMCEFLESIIEENTGIVDTIKVREILAKAKGES